MIGGKKIIATVGPASFDERLIRKMEQAGVDIFRINLSHTPWEKIEESISLLKSWTDNSLVCLDTEGAQLRTGTISRDEILIEEGGNIELLPKNMSITNCKQILLSIDRPNKILRIGDILKIDFHSALLQIIDEVGDTLVCRVLSNGKIGSNKGVSVDREIHLPAFTEKDFYAFNLAKRMGIKTIAFSFAANGDDIEILRQLFDYPVNIISKIESRLGMKNIEIICNKSNAVLIDRGDLSRDVPLEKIIFAQNYIIKHARQQNTPVYVATNLMENMIINSKPTRAEIHDIVATLNCGADGLVLAAETAIGRYPVECVRLMGRIIEETHAYKTGKMKNIEDFINLPRGRINEPHGGVLIRQIIDNYDYDEFESLPSLSVDYELISDLERIAEGAYSPLRGFMDIVELRSTLFEYMLPNGTVWTLPILFQIPKDKLVNLPTSGPVTIRDMEGSLRGLIKIRSIQKLNNVTEIAVQWFGTANQQHPGVFRFLTSGEYIIAGDVFMFSKKIAKHRSEAHYMLTPHQTRDIFNERNWHCVVGFHTRNVIHRGHQYIQKSALEQVEADALFISPVIGKKKKGDFSARAIITCYDQLIRSGCYKPYGAILAPFDTYSRYSGPREAVFTAICRKNFGCSHFIVGRDHTGVGNFYDHDASQRLFDTLNIGIKILPFSNAYYCDTCNAITVNCTHDSTVHAELSGTYLREYLINQKQIPNYLVEEVVKATLCSMYSQAPETVFEV